MPPQVIPNRISNNLILRKLRIGLNYKEEEMLGTLKLANFNLSKSELSALFRARDHKHYQDCGDQILRNFLIGLTAKYRPGPDDRLRPGARLDHGLAPPAGSHAVGERRCVPVRGALVLVTAPHPAARRLPACAPSSQPGASERQPERAHRLSHPALHG